MAALGYAMIARDFVMRPEVTTLSDVSYRAASYILHGPHSNMIGAFAMPVGYLASDMGWSISKAGSAIGEIENAGLISRFHDKRHLMIVGHFEINKPQNPNTMKKALKLLDALPADPLMAILVDNLRPFAEWFDKRSRERFTRPDANQTTEPLLPILDDICKRKCKPS
jgi:hypothetical protein